MRRLYGEYLLRFRDIHIDFSYQKTDKAAVIIDNRDLFFLPLVIKNFKYFLGDEWNIYHIKPNFPVTKDIYSKILKDIAFWERFAEEKILIFQYDCICCQPLDPRFLVYDFIGAPCGTDFIIFNGGLSLRSRARMIEAIKANVVSDEIEDYFFTKSLAALGARLPDIQTAIEFSVESIYKGLPFGVHGTDKNYHSDQVVKTIVDESIIKYPISKPDNAYNTISVKNCMREGTQERTCDDIKTLSETVRCIAFYLPQFHPIPENDKWWGKDFTEWTNVRAAQPLFDGHYQPHIPIGLGYYDLRSPEVRQAQAELAKEHGIYGFCYYHYWFNGKRLLELPFNEVLSSGRPDFPFCLCWANENWTRRWDGLEHDILMQQNYCDADDAAFIKNLIPAFIDKRYIRINGKPLLLVYRTGLLPDPKRTSQIWREAMHKAGIGDIYLARVETWFGKEPNPITPQDIGFDAAVEFAPDWRCRGPRVTALNGITVQNTIFDYAACMNNMIGKHPSPYKLFRGIFPSWDNTARIRENSIMFTGSSPEHYEHWLSELVLSAMTTFSGEERIIFINAWNEWGEGCHLEPDQHYGLAHLKATRQALLRGIARAGTVEK